MSEIVDVPTVQARGILSTGSLVRRIEAPVVIAVEYADARSIPSAVQLLERIPPDR